MVRRYTLDIWIHEEDRKPKFNLEGEMSIPSAQFHPMDWRALRFPSLVY